MFRNIGDGFRRFMYGRYGQDQLGNALLIFALALLLLGTFLLRWLLLPAYAAMIWQIIRCYSKNITARRRENAWFLRVTAPLRDRQNRYFRCPKCRQSVRVPKGKGRILIRCPRCGEKFEKKT